MAAARLHWHRSDTVCRYGDNSGLVSGGSVDEQIANRCLIGGAGELFDQRALSVNVGQFEQTAVVSADEEQVVAMAVDGAHLSMRGHLRQLRPASAHKQRLAQRVLHRRVHDRVSTHKVDHFRAQLPTVRHALNDTSFNRLFDYVSYERSKKKRTEPGRTRARVGGWTAVKTVLGPACCLNCPSSNTSRTRRIEKAHTADICSRPGAVENTPYTISSDAQRTGSLIASENEQLYHFNDARTSRKY